jgi:competence protein ComEC
MNEIVRIYFKNVGQGDCVFLEWKNENDEWELGIIDCNKKGTKDDEFEGILKHIEKFKKITFVLLSHPHYDHYSGLQKLLAHCEEKDISIGYIFDTALCITESLDIMMSEKKRFFESFSQEETEITELKNLFDTFKKWEKNKGTHRETLFNPTEIIKEVPGKLRIGTLSPSTSESNKYIQETFRKTDKNTYEIINKRGDANVLSTVIYIRSREWQVLLTSDTTLFTFERIKNYPLHSVDKSRPLVALQVPHHGSIENHYPNFWEEHLKKDRSHAVISAGKHKSYEHPHKEVVDYFYTKTKSLRSTNNVHGYRDFFSQQGPLKITHAIDPHLNFDTQQKSNRIIDVIDLSLNPVLNPTELCGEQIIKITESGDCWVEPLPKSNNSN